MVEAAQIKGLPQNLDAERVILGSVLLDSSHVDEVLAKLKQEDFSHAAHQLIFKSITQLAEREEEIDVILVADELQRMQEFHHAGGYAYLNDLTQGIPHIDNMAYYAELVLEKSMLRKLALVGQQVTREALDPENHPQDVLARSEQALEALRQGQKRDDFLEILPALNQTYSIIQERANKRGELIGVPTGFIDFDRKTNGMQRGDLVIVAARPAMGKTSFCLNLAVNAALKGNARVAVFSLEMPASQVSLRLLGAEARISISKLRVGDLDADQWAQLSQAVNALGQSQIFIEDSGDLNVYQIRSKLKRLKKEKGLDLVIIDYLQLMSSPNTNPQTNRTQIVSEMSRGLKILAKDLDVPVIALSQLSRAAEHRSDHRPQLADLRESGSIEQDADLVCFLYREDYYKREKQGDDAEGTAGESDYGLTELILAKHRNGPTGMVKLAFFKEYTRFENFEDMDETF